MPMISRSRHVFPMSTAQHAPKPRTAVVIPHGTPRGVSIIPYRNGLFAVSRRNKAADRYPGYWQFPGGGVEQNELAINAAYRELKEETGIDADARRLVFLGHDYPLIGYKGETYAGYRYGITIFDEEELQHTEPDKQSPWFWVTLSDLSGVQMLAGVREYAIKFQERLHWQPVYCR